MEGFVLFCSPSFFLSIRQRFRIQAEGNDGGQCQHFQVNIVSRRKRKAMLNEHSEILSSLILVREKLEKLEKSENLGIWKKLEKNGKKLEKLEKKLEKPEKLEILEHLMSLQFRVGRWRCHPQLFRDFFRRTEDSFPGSSTDGRRPEIVTINSTPDECRHRFDCGHTTGRAAADQSWEDQIAVRCLVPVSIEDS